MSDKRDLERLGARMRAERLTPSSGLISAIVGLFPERVQRRPKASLRFALAAGLAVALVSAVAAVGGIGYAQKQVTHAVVAVKSTVQSTVTLKPSSSARPSAPASASKQYKNGPVIRNVRPEPGNKDCPPEGLIITGQNLDTVTLVTVGGVPVKIESQNKNHITVKIPDGVTGKIVVSGPQGSAEYKKKLVGRKCD
jgi:IPT/TIG domain-containing protein